MSSTERYRLQDEAIFVDEPEPRERLRESSAAPRDHIFPGLTFPCAISTLICHRFETISSAVCLFLAIGPILLGQKNFGEDHFKRGQTNGRRFYAKVAF